MNDCQQSTALPCEETKILPQTPREETQILPQTPCKETQILSPKPRNSPRTPSCNLCSLKRRREKVSSSKYRTTKRTPKYLKPHINFKRKKVGPTRSTTDAQLQNNIFEVFSNKEEANRICDIVFREKKDPINTHTITPIVSDKQQLDEVNSIASFPGT